MASKLFFWVDWVKKVLHPFWWLIIMIVILLIPFLRPWWWFFAPLLLIPEVKTLYLWWMRWDYAYPKTTWVMLEIIPPKEVLTPLKAMEDVFTTMWGPLSDQPNWRERWCEGSLPEPSGWMSWEIVSIEGTVHFYLRIAAQYLSVIETSLYAHYPELEIHEVSDYVKNVPQNIPNEEWDMYGEDYILGNPSAYPIKTYEKFFEPQGEKISAEEKRIDPINSLLEAISKLGPGEQFWLQFTTMPIEDPSLKEEGEKIILKLAKRPEKAPKKTFFGEFFEIIYHMVVGPVKEGEGDKAKYKFVTEVKSETGEREMVLTPGEREIITEVENKLKKPVYRTSIRALYLAKLENWKAAHKTLARAYFGHFQTNNLNYIRFARETRAKVHYIFRKRRVFLRNRRLFRNYVLRFPPMFPERKSACALLSIEELATLFHFPIKITGMVLPTMSRVESKKAGPPPNLPMG